MYRSFFIVCGLFLGAIRSSGSTWIPFRTGDSTKTPVKTTVLESNESRTVVEFIIPGMEVRDTIVNGVTYQIIIVPEAGPGGCVPKTGRKDWVGMPQIATIVREVAIHPTKKVELNVLETERNTLTNYFLWPTQPPRLEESVALVSYQPLTSKLYQ